ncbi:MAG: 23S rRNA (guanosine(2251)-2'-O)-methyltransferase RlmB [Aestuariivirga sp.]
MSDEIDLIYGFHPVAEALRNPNRKNIRLRMTKNASDRLTQDVPSLTVPADIVHPRELDKQLGADAVHNGMLLEAKPLRQPRLDQIERTGVVVVLDQVTDPHNVGAILRTCAAFQVTALISTARHSPAASGVLFKAASGAYEHVPFVKVTNLARALEELKQYGFAVVGLDSSAPTAIDELAPLAQAALVLGAEGKGLRQLTASLCDHLVKLDLPGAITSLNVSNAAAIALYALNKK